MGHAGNKINTVLQQISCSRFIGMGRNEILQVARGGEVNVPNHPDLLPLVQKSPWWAKILKAVKDFCNAFLQGGFTDLDEICHDLGL